MAKLIYLRQSAEPRSEKEKREWFGECVHQARAEGCKAVRTSVHPDDDNLTLVEGWDVEPKRMGEPRWSMQAAR